MLVSRRSSAHAADLLLSKTCCKYEASVFCANPHIAICGSTFESSAENHDIQPESTYRDKWISVPR